MGRSLRKEKSICGGRIAGSSGGDPSRTSTGSPLKDASHVCWGEPKAGSVRLRCLSPRDPALAGGGEFSIERKEARGTRLRVAGWSWER